MAVSAFKSFSFDLEEVLEPVYIPRYKIMFDKPQFLK